jgi:hypothetical protein
MLRGPRRQTLSRLASTLALCLIAAAPAVAQTTSASVSGSIKDAQAAVLPGVNVTLTSSSQGTVMTAVTDELGNFLFPYVKPDTYTLKIQLDGFTTIQKTPVVVNANDRLAVGNFTMQVGNVSESITVSGRAADIQLRSGERAYTLESSAMQNLAVNGRSFFGLAGLVPGVIPNSDAPTQVSNLNANGQRSNSNNMTIDGVANIDTGDNGGNMAQTNLDAIAEFKVLTSSYQAEYGRAVGAQVQVVTKSGTQSFSGSGYWYGRRSDWNANTWINNRSHTAQAKSSRNDSGYTIGGPIYIPGLFNTDKKKLFFFWNQEFQRRNDPVGETRVTVPTALERAGDFSQSVDANGNPYPFIRDYASGLPCGAGSTAGCFQDGGVLGKIPANRLNQQTLKLLSLMPAPNVSGQVGYNYASQTPSKNPLNQMLFRTDYQLNSSWRITGRLMRHTNKAELPYGISGWSIRSNLDNIAVISDTPGRNWMVSTTGILNNTTSVEVQVGSGHNSLDHYSTSSSVTLAGLGLSTLPLLYPTPAEGLDLIPQITFGGGRIANSPFYNTAQAPFTNFNTTYDVVANLTKVMGAHQAKAGVYYQRSLKDQSAFANFNGSYDFQNNTNNPYDAQHPFANAALGIYNAFSQASSFLKPKWRYTNLEWYLQDNWKASGRLTLDYGLRFYFLTPQWDKSMMASNFLPDKFVSSQAVRLYQPSVVNGVRVGFDPATGTTVNSAFIGRVVPNSGDRFQGTFQAGNGISDTLTSGNKFAASPRVGVAYDLTGKQSFVARGGFGIFYDRPQGNQVFDLITNPPSAQTQSLTWGLVSQVGGTAGLNAPVSLNPNVYDWKLPTVYQWNAGIQMKLPAAFTLDVAYVGSESRNLLQQRQINALPYGTTFLPSAQDPTRGQACTGCSSLSTVPGANAETTDLLRPYQGYSSIRLWEFSAFSNYKALQTTLSRRFDRGFMFSVNYTRSSAKGIAGGDWDGARIDYRDREANYGPLAQDRPNVFVMGFVYQTPDIVKGPLGWAANGWQLSGNYRWMSGAPYGVGFSISGIGAANLTGSDQNARIVLKGDPGKGYSGDPYQQFDTTAFSAPGVGSNGLESPRVYMNLPPINNLDLSLSKSFPFGGKRRLEVRLDAFNALNHTQFSSVNTTANFSGLSDPTTIINLPYNSAGVLTNLNGFGTVSGVRNPRQLQLMTRFTF